MMDILIVDDRSDDISGPYLLVHHLGYKASLAFDGGEALREMKKRKFDLIILDWKMPTVSGGEFLRAIEAGAMGVDSKNPVKVILHSGEALAYRTFDHARLYQIVDIWGKPFHVADAARRLRLLVEKINRKAA